MKGISLPDKRCIVQRAAGVQRATHYAVQFLSAALWKHAGQDVQKGGFSSAAGAHDCQEPSLFGLAIDTIQD